MNKEALTVRRGVVTQAKGVTLVELMIATAMISIGLLGFIGAYRYISRSIVVSRGQTLAANLAQEKMQTLKNLSYYSLIITTAPASASCVSPISYDNANYPPDSIAIGGISFTRYTGVAMAKMNNGVVTITSQNYPDSGLKQIQVTVTWLEHGVCKQLSLADLMANTNVNSLSGTLSGTVQYQSGGPFPGAVVEIEGSPDPAVITGSAGTYSFSVSPGSYTIEASSPGYTIAVSPLQSVAQGQSVTAPNLTMVAVASGTIVGNVWIASSAVISQVVVSSMEPDGYELQYVELYNPTTAPISVAAPPPVNTPLIKLNMADRGITCAAIPLVYVSTAIPSYGYYLIANTNTFVLGGINYAADAYFNTSKASGCSPAPSSTCSPGSAPYWTSGPPGCAALLPFNDNGGVQITGSAGQVLDAVGWKNNNNGNVPPAGYCNGPCISFGSGNSGLPRGEQVVRISSPEASLSIPDMNAYGRAYNSENNETDFFYPFPPNSYGIQFPPKTSSFTPVIPIAGIPAVGAYVSANDLNSTTVQSTAAYISSGTLELLYSPFTLTSVSTTPPANACAGKCWSVFLASSGYFMEIDSVSSSQNVMTVIPDSFTVPASTNSIGSVLLSSTTTDGFVEGQVTDINGNFLSGIKVSVGGVTKFTGSNGDYFAVTSSGPANIIANFGDADPFYVQQIAGVTVSPGQMTVQNFTLLKGGILTGYATSGTTALPDIVFTALSGGSEVGSGVSDSAGYFAISDLSTGTYTVKPVLDPAETSSPASQSATVIAGAAVFVATFTIAGALGTIAGSVTSGGQAVTSGVLIIASTGPVSDPPPNVYGSSATTTNPIYAISSIADGTYQLPVRGGYTYNLGAYYPTINSNGTVTVRYNTYAGILVNASQTVTQNVAY